MVDPIDRQAAIDEIEERKNANEYRNVAVISELNRLEGYIMRLPSAQPDLPEWAKKVEEYVKSAPEDNPLAWALYQTWKEYAR